MTRVAIVGVPSQGGGRPVGTARGVGALRAAHLVASLRASHDAVDRGDVALPVRSSRRDSRTAVIDPKGLSALIRLVDEVVSDVMVSGRFPLVLGGDCPMLLGCVRAARRRFGEIGLLHVDAHEDHYTPERSPTGDSADSEIAFAVGTSPFTWDAELVAEQPLIQLSRLAVIGARDLSELARHGVQSLAERALVLDAELVGTDPDPAVARAIDAVSGAPGGFWVHLDWDVLDTEVMPAVICPLPGGLSWSAVDRVMSSALAHPGCRGMDAGTYDPDLDPEGVVAERIVEHLSRWLGAVGGGPADTGSR